MSNLAKSDNITKINSILNDVNNFFIGNMTADASLTAYKYQKVNGEDKSLFDKMTDLDFLSKDDKNNKDLNPLKEAIEQIKDFFDNRDLKDNSQSFDYDEFKEKVGNNISKAENSLDTFNKNNDYKNITSPGMRMFRAFLDKLDSININIETLKNEEPINDIKNEVNNIEAQREENEIKAEKMLRNCAENNIVYDNFDKDLALANNIDKKLEKMKGNVENIDRTLDDTKVKQEIDYLELFDAKLNIRSEELIFDELKAQKNDAFSAFLETANSRVSLENDLVAEGMRSYINLAVFQDKLDGIEDEELDQFKEELINKDPENVKNVFNNKEYEEYKNEINKCDYKSLKDLIQSKMQEYDDDINKTKDANPELLNKFDEAKRARYFSNNQFDKLTKLDEQYEEKENKYLDKHPEHENKLDDLDEEVKKYNSQERINEIKSAIPGKISKLYQTDKQVTILSNVSGMFKDEIANSEKSLPDLKEHIGKMDSIKAEVNQIKETDKSIENARKNLQSKVNATDINAQKENMMRGKLERFASQFSQCKRAGHSDSKEFQSMQKAVNDCLKDMSPENIKAMKKAADEYTIAKSGGWNIFNTKMRRHRLDLASSISEFSKTCEQSFGNEQKNNEMIALNNKANKIINNSSSSSIESSKKKLGDNAFSKAYYMSDKLSNVSFNLIDTEKDAKQMLISTQKTKLIDEIEVSQNNLNKKEQTVQNKPKTIQGPVGSI